MLQRTLGRPLGSPETQNQPGRVEHAIMRHLCPRNFFEIQNWPWTTEWAPRRHSAWVALG